MHTHRTPLGFSPINVATLIGLFATFLAASFVPAKAQYALEVGGVFSSANQQSGGPESQLRFYNIGSTAGTVSVTLSDSATGKTVANWTSPSIAPGAAPQFAITD